MSDDLRRAFAFIRRGDMFGTDERPTRFGTLVRAPAFPLRHDSNYLAVDALPAAVTADELAADADDASAAARLGHRAIVVRDAATGERLAPHFAALGWEVGRFLLMALVREPSRAADVTVVREVTADELRPARAANMPPWGRVEVREQLLDAKREIGARVDTRFFAAMVDGSVVSYADLYQDGDVAQIEDVGTVEEHRGRGYASAVVRKAVDEARASGARLIFLVTDKDDWPQHLYRKLGFDELGRYVKFTRPLR